MDDINHIYQLDECLDWIISNGFKRIAIQYKLQGLKHSVRINRYLKAEYQKRLEEQLSDKNDFKPLDIYISHSQTCCVDLIITQHVANIDAIIHIGNVCLSTPVIKRKMTQPPVLFVFTRHLVNNEDELSKITHKVLETIEKFAKSNSTSKMLILYDTALIECAIKLESLLKDRSENVDVANLYCPNSTWYTTKSHELKFIKDPIEEATIFGHHLLQKPLSYYNGAIYLGERLSINLELECPPKLIKINCYDNLEEVNMNVTRALNRRIALIERLKDEEELKVGVIVTNPLPDLSIFMPRLEGYAKQRKHTLYFISMIQTIDECKIGNFDLCDAFVVINSCTCSTILESLVFNRPLISELEFKLACGFEANYGRVLWPGSSSHLSEDDMINKRKVSDVTQALMQTRNELLERCSQARANKWSGLEYKASCGDNDNSQESLEVQEGLKGIASCYISEPLKRVNLLESDSTSLDNDVHDSSPGTSSDCNPLVAKKDKADI